MRQILVALLVLLALPAGAAAQRAPEPAPGQAPLEIRRRESPRESRLGRPVVPPSPQSEDAVREAERGVAEVERAARDQKLMREQTRQFPRRPDLGYDVQSGIQQKNLRRSLPH